MLGALLLCLLASTGSIRVRVEGGATEVVAYRDGSERARAIVAKGEALLLDLPAGAYDVRAEGGGFASDLLPDVRARVLA